VKTVEVILNAVLGVAVEKIQAIAGKPTEATALSGIGCNNCRCR